MTTLSYPYRKTNPALQILAALLIGLGLYLFATLAWLVSYQIVYAGQIFPGVTVAGVDVSGLTPQDAAVKLSQTLSYPYSGRLVFRDGDKVWVATPAELGMAFDPSASAQAAYRLGRSRGLFGALADQIRARKRGADASPVILFDERVAYQYLRNLAAQIDQPMLEASLSIQGTDVVAQPGQVGRVLNIDATLVYLSAQLQTFRDSEVPLVIQETPPQIMDVTAQAQTARQILSEPLRLVLPDGGTEQGPWTFDIPTLANMLRVQRVEDGSGPRVQVRLDEGALRANLVGIAAHVDQKPANARFVFNDETGQLDLIAPATIGRAVDPDATILAVNQALQNGAHTVPLTLVYTQPKVGDNATADELGIHELVSSVTSYFYGSSIARIQNIQTAAAQFHGVLIAPGETFSMGSMLGDISLDNGYAEALIIYGGRTIKGVGGGVCQVSTTLFRTAFFGGYQIDERHAHAYRVYYYEQLPSGANNPKLAGLDATVYFPLVDFKFTNDSPYWLLMETYVNPGARTLTWKFYSTKDGRSVDWTTSGPQNVVPAPKPLLEENSDLSKGEIKQVDWAADGADVSVTRTVTRDGQVIHNDQFDTHYEPWQAVCQFGPGTKDPEKQAKKQGLCQP
jgi:vancomycin resistance protein YoaR